MISWLIGVVTGLIYDLVGIAARLKPEEDARRMKAQRKRAWLIGFRGL